MSSSVEEDLSHSLVRLCTGAVITALGKAYNSALQHWFDRPFWLDHTTTKYNVDLPNSHNSLSHEYARSCSC